MSQIVALDRPLRYADIKRGARASWQSESTNTNLLDFVVMGQRQGDPTTIVCFAVLEERETGHITGVVLDFSAEFVDKLADTTE